VKDEFSIIEDILRDPDFDHRILADAIEELGGQNVQIPSYRGSQPWSLLDYLRRPPHIMPNLFSYEYGRHVADCLAGWVAEQRKSTSGSGGF
jgi:hypothetical protein